MELLLLLALFVHLDLALALGVCSFLVHLFCPALDLHDAEVAPHSGLDHQVVLLGLRTVRVVDDQAS